MPANLYRPIYDLGSRASQPKKRGGEVVGSERVDRGRRWAWKPIWRAPLNWGSMRSFVASGLAPGRLGGRRSRRDSGFGASFSAGRPRLPVAQGCFGAACLVIEAPSAGLSLNRPAGRRYCLAAMRFAGFRRTVQDQVASGASDLAAFRWPSGRTLSIANAGQALANRPTRIFDALEGLGGLGDVLAANVLERRTLREFRASSCRRSRDSARDRPNPPSSRPRRTREYVLGCRFRWRSRRS